MAVNTVALEPKFDDVDKSRSIDQSMSVGNDQRGGARKRKIRLGGEHMNLQPSAPISGQKIRKIKPFVFKTRDQKKYLARLRSSPCRSATQKKCKGRKLRQSCKYARGTKRAFCRRRSNKNYRA
jgi:hypothetical protein